MLGWTKRVFSRLDMLVRIGVLAVVVGLAVFVPTTMVAVEYTARSEFCNSCHIMEPYYESWVNSSHANVACIECHYEPGALETVEGKFQGLSQLAKYATRTEGTKPWAEVSDQSCMRSGCHSVRKLEGEIAFGSIKFDHRSHLLESRRGRRLRCTSCHSQIVQGDHVSVTDTVCFMCHFMPVDGEIPESTSDCLMCHGPPERSVEIAGRLFEHTEYIERGVDCQECHDPVVAGGGDVRRERCHSCHGEIGHIERFGETEFLHEMHVTEHKVECFECHDEIFHGLLPLKAPEPAKKEGCGACHEDTHGAAGKVYAGIGALGVADRPSRMFETRVVCDACHTGRIGRFGGDDMLASVHGGHAGSTVAAAGEVDCIHCHGPGFSGMLTDWQATVGAELDRLGPILDELEAEVAEAEDADARRLFEEARTNLLLVELDGSRGAHNVSYVLDVLGAVAHSTDAARTLLDPEAQPLAATGGPFLSAVGCSECHLGVEHAEDVFLNGRAFSHDRHLLGAAPLDCDACHATENAGRVGDGGDGAHGQPSFPREDCASCHHEEREDEAFDPYDCSACHAHQESFVAGAFEGFPELPTEMTEKACEDCHGEPPDIAQPDTALCALCHDEEYEPMVGQWQTGTTELVQSLERALQDAASRGISDEAVERARKALALIATDGSRGAHNWPFTEQVLEEALSGLE